MGFLNTDYGKQAVKRHKKYGAKDNVIDYITVLDAEPRRLCKVITPTETESYDNAYKCWYEAVPISSIFELEELLHALNKEPYKCIIRGELLPDKDPNERVLRQYLEIEGNDPFFRECARGRYFAMFDFDKIPIPDYINANDNSELLEYAIMLLPWYCHNVTYVYQWSSSAGIGDTDLLNVHIWMWLDEPRTSAQMKDWARHIPSIDPKVFETVQVHYTSAPCLIDIEDPYLNDRVGLVQKDQDSVSIPIVEPPENLPKSGGGSSTYKRGGKYSRENSFDQHLKLIGNPRYYEAIRDAIASWMASTGRPTDKARLKMRLWAAIGGNSKARPYLSDKWLDSMIQQAEARIKPIDASRPGRLPESSLEKIRYKVSKRRGM